MSTFHGLEMAKQTLFAQQSALYTTGHNIANANTKGYTRQRVNFGTMRPYPVPAVNRPEIPGQLGTGVEVSSIQRIRNKFLDAQFRSENSRMNHWETTSHSLSRMERLLNEPSDSGLSKTMDLFWESLNDLAVHPDKPGARSVVAERAKSVTDTFNHLAKSLEDIQNDLRAEIGSGEDKINSLLRQINRINEQVKTIEPHGYLANDLYDDRDRLIDELSELININVEYHRSEGGALDIADGIVSIELVDQRGQSFEDPIMLLEEDVNYADDYTFIDIQPDQGEGAIETIVFHPDSDADAIDAYHLIEQTQGSLISLISSFGYQAEDDSVYGDYPEMIDKLDQLAFTFTQTFNEIHQEGYDLNRESGRNFFEELTELEGAAKNVTVLQEIIDDPSFIAAGYLESGSEEDRYAGNGDNALRLADMFDAPIPNEDDTDVGLDNRSPREYLQSMISTLGIHAQEANRMKDNTTILRSQVDEQRMSVSAVSLDEEMSNMIKFQHAYNAAARNMTVIDEMIDRIINGMGLVGR
ncbi:MAG TPA: flagellar hook-associated protein FlgK [Bacillota bacterium]|nr:flagellar hook-associated protein FlgK [Bacillota bacterium]